MIMFRAFSILRSYMIYLSDGKAGKTKRLLPTILFLFVMFISGCSHKIEDANKLIGNKKYDEAIAILRTVQKSDRHWADAQTSITFARAEISKQVIAVSESLIQLHHWSDAKNALRTFPRDLPTSPLAQTLLDSINTIIADSILFHIHNLTEKNMWEDAKEVLGNIPPDISITLFPKTLFHAVDSALTLEHIAYIKKIVRTMDLGTILFYMLKLPYNYLGRQEMKKVVTLAVSRYILGDWGRASSDNISTLYILVKFRNPNKFAYDSRGELLGQNVLESIPGKWEVFWPDREYEKGPYISATKTDWTYWNRESADEFRFYPRPSTRLDMEQFKDGKGYGRIILSRPK